MDNITERGISNMKKTVASFLCAAVITTGLTACNGGNQTQGNMYRGSEAQMGYDYGGNDYNANYPYYGNGVGGKEYYQNNRFSQKNDRLNNPKAYYNQNRKMAHGRGITGNDRPGMVDENGVLNRKHDTISGRGMQFKRSSMHKKTTEAHYHKEYDGKHISSLTSELKKMDGVQDPRVMVHDNDVVIGYKSKGNQHHVDRDMHKHVQRIMGEGKHVTVTTDRDAYSSMSKMDDRLRTGAAFKEVENTFQDMMKDLGRAAKRPFEKSR